MTETRFLDSPAASPQENKRTYTDHAPDCSQHDRKFNCAKSSVDSDFLRFLEGTGLLDSIDDNTGLWSLLEPHPMINDLPGALSLFGVDDAKLATHASNPRDVVTAMPVSASPRDADETHSAATLPMPHKRRRLNDDEEVTSNNNGSPNDLVEVPSITVTTAAGQPSAGPAVTSSGLVEQASPAPAAAAPAAAEVQQESAEKQLEDPADGSSATLKAVLVAKVLTKSDAASKRVILPRIAIEANLPQLASMQAFNFSAEDTQGHSWPLVIKAWANGQNPKPVYVLEQVGELLKQEKLTAGDSLAVLASQDGRFFLEWNTEQTRAAAARPTYTAFTFTAAAAAAAAASGQPAPAGVVKQEPGSSVAAVSPVASDGTALAPSSFLPGQLLVVNHPTMTKDSYLHLDESQEGGITAATAAVVSPSAAGEAAAVAAPSTVTAAPPLVGANGALHMGGFLVCPRTPGCTRPAGHQGWCLGHKGFKKRRG